MTMRATKNRLPILFVLLTALTPLAGCTLYASKNPPTLVSTTSAEQYERLYWQAVKEERWPQVTAMQAPNVVYVTRVGGLMNGPQWIAWLQSAPLGEYLVGEVQVRPQGTDMAVSYSVTVAPKRGGATADLAVVSVWQQTKQGWIMIAHSETPRAALSNSPSAN